MAHIEGDRLVIPYSYSWYGEYNTIKKLEKLKSSKFVENYRFQDSTIKAIFVPHAGLKFSGQCAATAYESTDIPDHVVLVCTDHSMGNGIVLPNFDIVDVGGFGSVTIDKALFTNLGITVQQSSVKYLNEHSFHNQLPFLIGKTVAPILCGRLEDHDMEEVVNKLVESGVFTVFTSDLSHVNGSFDKKIGEYNKLVEEDSHLTKYLCGEGITDLDNFSITTCGPSVLRIVDGFVRRTSVYPRQLMYYTSANPGKPCSKPDMSPHENLVSYTSYVYTSRPYLELDKIRTMDMMLTRFEKDMLVKTAVSSIISTLENRNTTKPVYTKVYNERRGCFVTIKKKSGELRGCIGTLNEGQYNLLDGVEHFAKQAAFHDPRFDKLKVDELDNIVVSVSFLGPKKSISKEEYFSDGPYKPGLDGVFLTVSSHSAYYLPTVITEHNMTKESQLESLCEKAGLNKTCHQSDDLQLEYNEGIEFTITNCSF